MKWMGCLVFIVLVPLVSAAQTIHVADNRILYRQSVDVPGVSADELLQRAHDAIKEVTWNGQDIIVENREQKLITARGNLRLTTPYHLVRKVEYLFEISAKDGVFKYRIDSVSLVERERGEEAKNISSEQLLKGVEATGPESVVAEKLVNEIDMRFQKLIALVCRRMIEPHKP